MFINTIKVYLIHFFKFQLKGIKPTRIRVNEIRDNGYSIDLTSGGTSNEGFVRITKGLKNWYYPNYTRKNSVRVNDYVLNVYNNKI